MYPPSDTKAFRFSGKTIKVLGPEDILQKGDYARKLVYPNYACDYVNWGYTRDMDWRKVGDKFGETLNRWIGEKIKKINTDFSNSFEIIRVIE